MTKEGLKVGLQDYTVPGERHMVGMEPGVDTRLAETPDTQRVRTDSAASRANILLPIEEPKARS